MLKNTLKQILAVAAFGCLAATANAQMRYTAPMFSARLGGPLVAGMNVGYYNNGINTVAAAYVNPFMRYSIGGAFGNPGAPIVNRAPLDGTQVPLTSIPPRFYTNGGYFRNNTFVNPGVNRAPLDGTQVPLAFVAPRFTAGGHFVNGTFVNPGVNRAPLNGTQVPLTALRR